MEGIDLEAEFEAFFKDSVQVQKLHESNLMEQANVLMERGVGEDNQDVLKILEGVGNGKKIARLIRQVIEGRKPQIKETLKANLLSLLFSCRARDEKISLERMSEEEFANLNAKYPLFVSMLGDMESKNPDALVVHNFVFAKNEVMKLLSEYIWRRPALKCVDLSHVVGMFGMRGLILAHSLKHNQCIQEIKIIGADCSLECIAALALVSRMSVSIQRVVLTKVKIKDTGAMFWGLALANGATFLNHLELSYGSIGDLGAISLSSGLKLHRRLRVLILEGNHISRLGCRKLGEALVENPLLEELNLNENSIGSRGASAVAAFLLHPKTQLKTLHLCRNDIGPKGGKALAIGISVNKSLLKFVLSQNDLGDEGLAGFGMALELNASLLHLDLSDNDMTDIGAAGVILGLKKNNTLKSLHLANSIIRDAGAEEIARCMRLNQGLEILNLERNAISDHGAQQLADMLSLNYTLKELRLNDNEIGNPGGIALGKMLAEKENLTLQILDVTNNPIGAEVSKKWFHMAETRLIDSESQQVDIVAEGTAIARGNLREFGVVVHRTRTSSCYSLIMIFVSLSISLFDFASDLAVVVSEYFRYANNEGGQLAYVILTMFFVFFPFLYVLLRFSYPASETDNTLQQGVTINARKPNRGSCLSFFYCSRGRLFLTLINIFQIRLAYELFLSWQQGLTTLAFSSIRLAEVVFEALPQSLIQIHILLSAASLTKVRTQGVWTPTDNTIVVLIVSVSISLLTLSKTISDLFEKKYVVNWKRNSFHNEDLAMGVGYFLAFFFHLLRYATRALTIAMGTTIYGIVVCVSFLVVGVLARLMVAIKSHSERNKSFALVCYFVGSSSWDTRWASRMCHLFEVLELLAVIIPLWIPVELIEAASANTLAFSDGWLPLVVVATPPVMTGLLCSTWFVSEILYFAFIERIHHYSDVLFHVDTSQADKLARRVFSDHDARIRKRRRDKLQMAGGDDAKYGQLLSSSNVLLFNPLFTRGKREEFQIVVDESSSQND